MDTEGFWALVEASARACGGPDERLTWLTERLAGLPATEVVDFQLRLDEAHARADTTLLWVAALRICGGLCSDDGFRYFQAWLVGLGRSAFERAVAAPDTLADVPQVRRLAGRPTREWSDDEWPDWESLDYVADEAHERITGVAEGLEGAVLARGGEPGDDSPDPGDEPEESDDPAEFARRYPRLAAMFPPIPARL
ncbi:DUF4240 domain-containing protein [Micromonospora sp. NPDC020750]|uniref:DUF4240 domain-containing protein n=1 Tax=unclassified Micromonospora TaxID=2617518 RepID=UPI0037AEE3BB